MPEEWLTCFQRNTNNGWLNILSTKCREFREIRNAYGESWSVDLHALVETDAKITITESWANARGSLQTKARNWTQDIAEQHGPNQYENSHLKSHQA